jgi:hypothetical protein
MLWTLALPRYDLADIYRYLLVIQVLVFSLSRVHHHVIFGIAGHFFKTSLSDSVG